MQILRDLKELNPSFSHAGPEMLPALSVPQSTLRRGGGLKGVLCFRLRVSVANHDSVLFSVS